MKIGNFFFIPPEDWLFRTHRDVMESRNRAERYKTEHTSLQGKELQTIEERTSLYKTEHTSLQGAEYQIEEFVRQWVLRQLIEAYNYPEEWIGERIIIEEPVKMGSTTKEADISLRNKTGRTFLYIEVKRCGLSESEFREAEQQLETYLASTHTATIGMVTDGDNVRNNRYGY